MKRVESGAVITKYASDLFDKELSESTNYVSDVILQTEVVVTCAVMRSSRHATSRGVREDYHSVSFNKADMSNMICPREGTWCHPQQADTLPAYAVHFEQTSVQKSSG